MIMEPAKSNVIDCNGSYLFPALLVFADGFGHALGQKVKLKNWRWPQYTSEYYTHRERLEEWYGI